MLYEDLTQQIIGCAYRVYNIMGFGYLESVYEKCLIIELRKIGLKVESQKPVIVHYLNQIVGNYIADIVVENKIIIELKSVKNIVKAHEVQLVNYLTATGLEVGLVINFAESEVEIKRKVRELKKD
ncbi:MAG: GxxExxY protein [Armatimonadetes bacterium]|nr:GxxExxY protein [Armatimonadota bacterium]